MRLTQVLGTNVLELDDFYGIAVIDNEFYFQARFGDAWGPFSDVASVITHWKQIDMEIAKEKLAELGYEEDDGFFSKGNKCIRRMGEGITRAWVMFQNETLVAAAADIDNLLYEMKEQELI